jgi:hypothetical protein
LEECIGDSASWFELSTLRFFGLLAFREDFGKMMVASMTGRQAPGISRPPVVLRSSCSGVLHRAAVSVRGLAGASCMDSTLRILRPLSGTGMSSIVSLTSFFFVINRSVGIYEYLI